MNLTRRRALALASAFAGSSTLPAGAQPNWPTRSLRILVGTSPGGSPDIIGRLKGDVNYGNGRVEKGTKQYMKFWSEHASYPFKSHDLWFVTEDIRWGKFEPSTDTKALVNKVNREDLWRDAAKALSLPASDIPASPSRGKETFFDGKVFDPDNPGAYLKSLSIKRVEV
jgi:nitrate/nitrite transport system substrate-binding protein